MSTNDIFLHTLQLIDLSTNSSFIQDFGCFLELCSRHETLCLQSGTCNTLKYLCRCSWYSITYLNCLEITVFQMRIFITQLTCCNDLSFLHRLAVSGISNHLFTPDSVIFL